MKFESDTEIDRLLRRHARRAAASMFAAPETAGKDDGAATPGAGGAHLDTDELNAYAEGALPAAARMKYVTHLADCDECRGLVTKLTLAANVAVETHVKTTPAAERASSSWRDWLAALFAPAVLRYAVPALALLAVIAVAFIATRERRQDLVAQNEQQQSKPTTEQARSDDQGATTATANTVAPSIYDRSQNSNSSATVGNPQQSNANASATPETQKKEATPGQNSVGPQNEPKPSDQPTALDGQFGKQAGLRDESPAIARSQPAPVTTTAPAAKTPAEDRKSGEEETGQKSVDAIEKDKNAAPAPNAGSSSGLMVNKPESRARGNAQATQDSGARENPARKSRPASPQLSTEAGRDDSNERRTETRSAGGHRFRREGGAWVDVAYSSSRGVVNVARGSEQYRALVADEPGLRAIADQLGGTVIVVWKTRAYRIY